MSLTQLTEYINKGIPSSNTHEGIKQEFQANRQVPFENDMICRVCTSPADIPVTDKMDDTLIITAIRSVANISITDADFYPKYVCKLCLGELEIAYRFKKKCEVSDMAFKNATSLESILVSGNPLVKRKFSIILNQMKQNTTKVISIKNNDTYNSEFNSKESQILLSPTLESIVPVTNFKSSPKYLREEVTRDDESYDDNEEMLSPNLSIIEEPAAAKIKPLQPRKIKLNVPSTKLKVTGELINTLKDSLEDNLNCKANNNDVSKVKTRTCKTKLRVNKCKPCDLQFETKEEFQKHRRENNCVHHACPQCGKLVLNLGVHQRVVHARTNKYTCHQCGKVYYSSAALINHMYKHRDTKEYYCAHCPYRGKRKSYLVCHMRVHTRDYRYLCAMCPLTFSNYSNLAKHQLVHYTKKFECSECKRTFRQERGLKEHFDAAHLNIRYRCTICGKDLNSRKKLLSHELRVHKREKHKLFDEVQRVVIGNDNDC